MDVPRCTIMNLCLLGFFYFYVAITPIASLGDTVQFQCTNVRCVLTNSFDMDNSTEETVLLLENCTQCNVRPYGHMCIENAEGDGCSVCDRQSWECCYCADCSMCWRAEWQLMTMTHISISILFVLGIAGLILMYCKLCHRTRQLRSARCFRVQQAHEAIMHCSTVDGCIRERPPQYSEVCGAPPLYTSPYNRTSMQDAPPRYPDTPESQKRCRCIPRDTSLFSILPVAQHM